MLITSQIESVETSTNSQLHDISTALKCFKWKKQQQHSVGKIDLTEIHTGN